MKKRWVPFAAWISLAAILQPALAVGATGTGARLEGLVMAVDGRAAVDHRVHLIDSDGRVVAQATTTDEGLYSFAGLAPGSYALGIENPQGLVAPVATPPMKISDGQLARRDIKLMESDAEQVQRTATANYGLGLWWAGLSAPARVWTIIGLVTAAWITYEALDSESSSSEGQGSAFTP